MVGGPRHVVVRRCPTLPHSLGCSTIGAVGLSFRVRNGTGRFLHAMTAVTLCTGRVPWFLRCCPLLCVGGGCGVGVPVSLGVRVAYSVVSFHLWWWWWFPVVGWEPHSGRVACVIFTPPPVSTVVGWGVCGVSYRLISTGQLHRSLVPASTSGLSTQWSGWGPLTL